MKKLIIILSLCGLIISCKKSTDSSSEPIVNPPDAPIVNLPGQMSGKIVLPIGSSYDLLKCKVVSRFGVSAIAKNSFTVDTTESNLSPIFLIDENNQPIMMRYLYPGQQDNDFTVRSTSLGLVMSLPSVQSLTDSAKLALLPTLNSTSEINVLEDEIAKKLKTGGTFIDGKDATLNEALSKMFVKATTLRVAGVLDNPISLYYAGNQISVVNNGTANIYGVGLYKNGHQIGDIHMIGGYDYLPTSLSDIINQVYSFATHSVTEEPTSFDATLSTDGEYTLKIRSGGQEGDNSTEASAAFRYDMVKGTMNTIALFVPDIKKGECKKTVISNILSFISNAYSLGQIEGTSLAAFSKFTLIFAQYFLSNISDLIVGCNKEEFQNSYLKALTKFLYYINIVGAANSAINSSIIAIHLNKARPVIDTCFKVSNGKITPCNNDLPTLTTSSVTSITSSTSSIGGNITNDGGAPITARGVVWSSSPNPTIINNNFTNDGTGSGIFSSNITGLTAGLIYHVRAYATNSAGTAYGNEVSFTTTISVPVVETASVTSITGNSASSGGNIADDGGAPVTARGVCWSISNNPTITDNKTNEGAATGNFTSSISGLTAGKTYYVRSYATNNAGTAYGNEVSFTTNNNDLNGTVWYGYYRSSKWEPDWGYYYPNRFPVEVPKGNAPVTIKFSTTTDEVVKAVMSYVWNGSASSSLSGIINSGHTEIIWTSATFFGDAVPSTWEINANKMTGTFSTKNDGGDVNFTFFKL